MTGIILSLLATFAVLIFVFHADESSNRINSRYQDSGRNIPRQSDDVEKVNRISNKIR
jgi:hypothetical protein